MALSLESAGKVRQKTLATTRGPLVFYALKALFLHLAANKGNPDLQFVNIDPATIDDSGGQVCLDAACTLYFVYGKKQNTATDVYLAILDDASNDAGGDTDLRITLPFLVGNQEAFAAYPDGIAMAAGVVAKAYTSHNGTTDSSTADCPAGFIIVAGA